MAGRGKGVELCQVGRQSHVFSISSSRAMLLRQRAGDQCDVVSDVGPVRHSCSLFDSCICYGSLFVMLSCLLLIPLPNNRNKKLWA